MNKKKILIISGIVFGSILLITGLVFGTQYLASKGYTLFKVKQKAVKKEKVEDKPAAEIETNLAFLDMVDETYSFLFNTNIDKLEVSKLTERQKFCLGIANLTPKYTYRTLGTKATYTYSYKVADVNYQLEQKFGDQVKMTNANIGPSKLALTNCIKSDSTITYNKNANTFQHSETYDYASDFGDDGEQYSMVDYRKKWNKVSQGEKYITLYASAYFIATDIDETKVNSELEKMNAAGENFTPVDFEYGTLNIYKDSENKVKIGDKSLVTYLYDKNSSFWSIVDEVNNYLPYGDESTEYMAMSYTYKFVFNKDNNTFVSFERIK